MRPAPRSRAACWPPPSAARLENPARGAADRWLRLALVALLPLVALALYLPTGRPDLPSQPFATRDQSAQEMLMAAMREADALARTLAETPDNPAGWVELGQRYRDLGRPEPTRSRHLPEPSG